MHLIATVHATQVADDPLANKYKIQRICTTLHTTPFTLRKKNV